MSGRRDSLSPPEKPSMEDPGAHELESSGSGSDDHFSDAQSAQSASHPQSPIPKTRVEKVDDEPSYGEVPGTAAYRMREGDAEPDEIAIVPDEVKKEPSKDVSPSTPGGKPIPTTVVEESAGPMNAAHETEKYKADANPDVVLKADGKVEVEDASDEDEPISPVLKTPQTSRSRRKSSAASTIPCDTAGETLDDEDDFGDDFDDFEEGGGEDAADEDFGDFDEAFQASTTQPAAAAPSPAASLAFPIPDFEGLDADDILTATEPYLDALYPPSDDLPTLPPSTKENPIFLTQRSASLWSQLVAPPPLQPPDWIRSRIRRLFLVSLGVPVDLDEILPASKQKKLILPSLSVQRDSPRTSTDSRPSAARLKGGDGNASSTSVDSHGKPKESSSRKRRGPPPAPDLDLVTAKQLCETTDEALDGMTNKELQSHVARLVSMEDTAKDVLEYWKKRTDEKIGDRETFEGVIENLVKHARKVRK